MDCRQTIADYNKVTDPAGVRARSVKCRIRRRVYYAAGVNHIWTLDQHDKWQKYGLRMHLCLEPYTGKILWLRVWWNNRNPNLIASYYFTAVRQFGGACFILMYVDTHFIISQDYHL
jgi:hypothetical protein